MDLELENDVNERSALSLQNAKKQGYLNKEGGKGIKKNWKKRWFILHEERLYYFTDDGARKPKGVIKLMDYASCTPTNDIGGRFAFKICPKEKDKEDPVVVKKDLASYKNKKNEKQRTYLICASKQADRDSWVEAISEAIKELKGRYGWGRARIECSCFIKVTEAKLLDKTERDTYCTIMADNLQKGRTLTAWKSCRPVFDQECEFDLAADSHHIVVQLRDSRKKKDNIIGQTMVLTEELHDQKVHDGWYKLSTYHHSIDIKGELNLLYYRKDKEVKVTVLGARDLIPMSDGTTSDPLVSIQYGTQVRFTPIMRKMLSPKWNEKNSFSFDIVDESTPFVIEAFHDNRDDDSKDSLGEVVLSLSDITTVEAVRWLGLQAKCLNNEDEVVGEIRLMLHMQYSAILPDKEYDDLLLLLLSNGMSLTKKLAAVSNQKEKPIAECLVKAFEMRRSAFHFLKIITKEEIEATMSYNVIFRGNTVGTKSVDMYMRLVGMPYLHHVMKPVIVLIVANTKDKKKSCELDPARLTEEKEEKKTKIIGKNLVTLLGFVEMIFTSIRNTFNFCPANFRNIFAHIRTEVLARFPDHPLSAYTATAGFIFLRFFCPSLLAPKSFGLTDEHPAPNVARDLTLIAKCLQNLANLVEFGKKESFMAPCNKYITDNIEAMKAFLNKICSPPDEAVDELPVKNQINWGREMARVHFHLADNLEAMQEKFSRNCEDIQKLEVILAKMDVDVKRELNDHPRIRLRGNTLNFGNESNSSDKGQGMQKVVPRVKPRVGSTSGGSATTPWTLTNSHTPTSQTATRLGTGRGPLSSNFNSSNGPAAGSFDTWDHPPPSSSGSSSPPLMALRSGNDPEYLVGLGHGEGGTVTQNESDDVLVRGGVKPTGQRNNRALLGRERTPSSPPQPQLSSTPSARALGPVIQCGKCGQGFTRNEFSISALNRRWHSACFTCTTCTRPIGTSFVITRGMPQCLDCQPTVTCCRCDQKILDRHIAVGQDEFHPGCLRCDRCEMQIQPDENFEVQGNEFVCAVCLKM